MLKSCTGYSTAADNITLGIETAKNTLKDLSNSKIGFLYTSEKNNIKAKLCIMSKQINQS